MLKKKIMVEKGPVIKLSWAEIIRIALVSSDFGIFLVYKWGGEKKGELVK